MGRIQQSQGLPPPAIRKDQRSKQAKHIINKRIPAILASNSRARKGADGSVLIVNPGPVKHDAGSKNLDTHQKSSGVDEEDGMYIKRKGQGKRRVKGGDEVIVREGVEGSLKSKSATKGRKNKKGDDAPPLEQQMPSLSISEDAPQPKSKKPMTFRVITTDTLTAADILYKNNPRPKRQDPNVLILNMASPLRPGGGVLAGATSQEEFLCTRTTLLPSLKETFYRLPEIGGVYTSDVLVFRDASPLDDAKGELGVGEKYWVDVVSAGMLRFPDLEGEEEEEKRLAKKDREIVEAKMRAVLRMACEKGVKRVVLGAWGCGAYGNPVVDIADAWRRVLLGEDGAMGGGKKMKKGAVMEKWDSIEEVVFAIANRKMAGEFAECFGGGISVEDGPGGNRDLDDDDDEEDAVAEELRTKIREMESQLAQVWNPDLKSRMGIILDGLKAQLQEREAANAESDEDEGEGGVGLNGETDKSAQNTVESSEHYDYDLDEESEEESEQTDGDERSSPKPVKD